MKEKVIEMRVALKELLNQGQSVAQVLREHQELAKENEKNRLVYSITADNALCLIACRGHYEKRTFDPKTDTK